ncbi:hypothetical protein [Flavobacterium branchiophilum]|nr:hypothetical protein [Flavobacterium branchiophilum]
MTKSYYREILNSALQQAKEEYENSPNDSLNESIYNQLVDIKKTVVVEQHIYTEAEANKKYPLGVMVVRNFDGYLDMDWDYPKKLIDVSGGIPDYPTMPEGEDPKPDKPRGGWSVFD